MFLRSPHLAADPLAVSSCVAMAIFETGAIHDAKVREDDNYCSLRSEL